jgi:hypothetical protein
VAYFSLLFRNLRGETEEQHQTMSLAGRPAVIRNGHLPNTSLGR